MPTECSQDFPRFRQPRRPEGHSGVRRRRDDLECRRAVVARSRSHHGADAAGGGLLHRRPQQDRIEHRVETLIAQRIHGVALGYEDLNDHDELRHDPVLGLVSGKAEARRSDCAGAGGAQPP